MVYQPITPFGRTAESVLQGLRARAEPAPAAPLCPRDKWQILRDLTAARQHFGLSDRDLTVLQALLSFHPQAQLDPSAALVVHPSNAAICERAHAMACSTMRRHLARLVEAGLLQRRDSPNGKRYTRRLAGEKLAFGFDLRPLVLRASAFAEAAEAAREAEAALKAQRDTVSLLRRDLAALAERGALDAPDACDWPALALEAQTAARTLRRKLDLSALQALETGLREAVETAARLLAPAADELGSTMKMSSCNVRNEQHCQNSDKDLKESEAAEDFATKATESLLLEPAPAESLQAESREDGQASARVPALRRVLASCRELATFAPGPIRDWPSFLRAAEALRPMLGIASGGWEEAKRVMGREHAAVALVAMLERFAEIRNPGGYLRHLVNQARIGAFSSARMVAALSARTA